MEAKSRTQLAHLYGFGCTRTFKRRLQEEEIDIPKRKAIYWQDQLKIYAQMGIPPNLDEAEKQKVILLLSDYCKNNNLPLLNGVQ